MKEINLQCIAILLIEQYEIMAGGIPPEEAQLISEAAARGPEALLSACRRVFGGRLDEALTGAATGARDYLLWAEDSFDRCDAEDRDIALRLAQGNLCAVRCFRAAVRGDDIARKRFEALEREIERITAGLANRRRDGVPPPS